MFTRTYTVYRRLAKTMTSEEYLIKYVSTDIYNRIGFIKNHLTKGLIRIHEVTLTQNLVFEIHKFESETGLRLVDLYEATNEKMNGADLVLGMQVGTGYLKIPMQAKILKPFSKNKDGSYSAFHHKNSFGKQSDLLKKFAEECGSYLPLYLLYNYTYGSSNIAPGENEHYYGCSCVSAERVPIQGTSRKTMRFSDLHPLPAIPWYRMFRTRGSNEGNSNGGTGGTPSPNGPEKRDPNDEIRDFYKQFGRDANDEFINQLTFYTYEELTAQEEDWERVSPSDAVENIKTSKQTPKYKLVFLPNPMYLNSQNTLSLEIDDATGEQWPEEMSEDIAEYQY